MGINSISSVTTTDLSTQVTTASVDTKDTEISYYTPNWTKWHGYYRYTPEIQATIDKICMWASGKGIKAKEASRQKQLDKITGIGKDTIRDIVQNLMRTATICGDAFAEIIKDDRGALKNLKVLSPGTIQIITDQRGMIIGYEQISLKTNGAVREKIVMARWKPEEIFHLSWNRIADETHGISTIEKIENIILKRKDAQDIMEKYFRRMVYPVRFIEVDTDNESEMSTMKTKYETAINKGEVILVPKDTTKISTDDPNTQISDALQWMFYLQKYFIMSEGVPEVILGSINSKDTEGASKILYLAFEQAVKNKQNWFEEQWKAQIGFEVDLPEPPSIDPMILTDMRKGGGSGGAGRLSDVSPSGQNK